MRKAAGKAVREVLIPAAVGIAMGLVLLYAVLNDPYELPAQDEEMIQAIDGDYYYPASRYEQYLQERQAYLDEAVKEQQNDAFQEPDAVIQDMAGQDLGNEDRYRLAKMAMAEAEGEDTEGKALVMLVILNRVQSSRFPDSIDGVITQKDAFTSYSNGRYDSVEPSEDCWKALELITAGQWNGSEGALYFERTSDQETWHSQNLQKLFIHGNHTFYKEYEKWERLQ